MRHNLKQSSIMVDLHDYNIELIEKESLRKNFAITDFIHIRKFETEINIDVLLSLDEKTIKTE